MVSYKRKGGTKKEKLTKRKYLAKVKGANKREITHGILSGGGQTARRDLKGKLQIRAETQLRRYEII